MFVHRASRGSSERKRAISSDRRRACPSSAPGVAVHNEKPLHAPRQSPARSARPIVERPPTAPTPQLKHSEARASNADWVRWGRVFKFATIGSRSSLRNSSAASGVMVIPWRTPRVWPHPMVQGSSGFGRGLYACRRNCSQRFMMAIPWELSEIGTGGYRVGAQLTNWPVCQHTVGGGGGA